MVGFIDSLIHFEDYFSEHMFCAGYSGDMQSLIKHSHNLKALGKSSIDIDI